MWWKSLLCGVLCVTSGFQISAASDSQRSAERIADRLPTADWGETLSGPLCGVYAACTAVELLGREAHPHQFITSEYVGRCGGSTAEEVANAVQKSGCHAHIITRLSALDLQLVGCPVIANVRVNPANDRFNHWVVVVPTPSGVRVYDGLQSPYEIGIGEFLGNWSGIGICATADESNPLVSIWLGRASFLLIMLIGVVAVLRNKGFVERINQLGPVRQVVGIGALSLVFTIAGNAVFGDLLHHGKAVSVAAAPSQSRNYTLGTLDDARKASSSSEALLIDARMADDYELGTIAGAVNIPVTASTWAINSYLEKLDRDTPIVVFCQSALCPYDETIGGQLVSLGFRNVTVCNEGYSEFKKQQSERGSLKI